MARRGASHLLPLVIAATLMVSMQRSASQTLPLGCSPTLSSLSPCISYLVGNSSTPTPACCSPLTSLVQTQAQCLCAILGGGITQLGFLVNQTQALALPGACNIRFSTSTSCAGFTASTPVGAPAASPTASPTPIPPPTSPPPPPVAAPPTTPSSTVPSGATPSVPSASAPSGNGSKTKTEASIATSSTKFSPALVFSSLILVGTYAWM